MSQVRPVEHYVFQGLIGRFYEVFGVTSEITTTPERLRAKAAAAGGAPLSYPYMFLKPTSVGRTTTGYNSKGLARRGIPFVVQDDGKSASTVRLLPMTYAFECIFITDQFDLQNDKSVLSFARRWLFAREIGSLKFNVNYGRISLPAHLVLDEQVSLPEKGAVTDSKPEYEVTASFSVESWGSEPTVGTVGIVQDVQVDVKVGAQEEFWKFPRST